MYDEKFERPSFEKKKKEINEREGGEGREGEKTGNTVSPHFASTYFKCYTGYSRFSRRVFSAKETEKQ